jgi:TolB-like protein/Tfp pilus assembly protein PilF
MPCCLPDSVGQRCRVNAKNFFAELKRRNVYKVAVAYAIVGWLLIQVATQVFPFFEIPNWAVRLVVLLIIIGFPIALVIAWAFELTPEGLKRTESVDSTRLHPRNRTWIYVVIIAGAISLGLFFLGRYSAPKQTAPAEIPAKSIAVLPFENLSRDPDNAFFTDGVQDEILANLAKVADLKVISRTSVMLYKSGNPRNLREIGQQLGVAHVLEGSVQRAAHRVRVTAQLIDARTDAHLWADTYDRDLADVFAIQSEIAKMIADQLQAKISRTEKAAIEQRPTADVTAFDLYSRAKTLNFSTSFSAASRQNLLQAADLLNQAIARDPSFFLAYSQLAFTHDYLYFLGIDHTAERLALAEAALKAAFRLQPDAGEAHLARAENLYHGHLDYEGALVELDIARRTLPNDPRIFEFTGYIRRRQGHQEEGLQNLQRALELDPRNFFTLQQISLSYQVLRRFPETAAVLDRALAIVPKDVDTRVARAFVDLDWRADPRPLHATIEAILAEDPAAAATFADSWLTLALCERDLVGAGRALAALGDNSFGDDAVRLSRTFGEGLVARLRGDTAAARTAFSDARAKQEKLVQAQPEYGPALCVLGLIDAGLGRKEDALREGRRAVELLPVAKDFINGAHVIEYFAVIAAWAGEKDLACEQLEITTRLPGAGLTTYGKLKLSPFWDPLRGYPRFEKIVNDLAPKRAAK